MTPGGQTKNIARAIKTLIAAKAILGAQIATVSVTVIPNAVHIQIFVPKNIAAILYINAVFRKETRGLQTVTVNATVESIAARMRVTPIPLTRTADAQSKKCAVPDRPGEKIPFVVDATRYKNVAVTKVTSGRKTKNAIATEESSAAHTWVTTS